MSTYLDFDPGPVEVLTAMWPAGLPERQSATDAGFTSHALPHPRQIRQYAIYSSRNNTTSTIAGGGRVSGQQDAERHTAHKPPDANQNSQTIIYNDIFRDNTRHPAPDDRQYMCQRNGACTTPVTGVSLPWRSPFESIDIPSVYSPAV